MKILIVDDEFINRALLANILFNAGYKDCIEAKNGREAIALLCNLFHNFECMTNA